MTDGFIVEDKRGGSGESTPGVETKEETNDHKAPTPPPMPTFVESLMIADVLGPWIANGVFPQKYEIDRATGMVTDSKYAYADPNLPWVMVNNDGTRECEFYKDVDRIYNFIPPPCLCCWKVVVMPRTVRELFQLLKIELEMVAENPYCFCKCGIEKREEVERLYGGYFYCNDLQQGLIRLSQVKERVHAEISPDVPVILKRACTEYERKYGPSDKWDQLRNPSNEATWQSLLKVFKTTKQFAKQPTLIQKHIQLTWVAFAAMNGDKSVKELNGGKSLYPGYVTYDWPKTGTIDGAVSVKEA